MASIQAQAQNFGDRHTYRRRLSAYKSFCRFLSSSLKIPQIIKAAHKIFVMEIGQEKSHNDLIIKMMNSLRGWNSQKLAIIRAARTMNLPSEPCLTLWIP
jgi:hypothetical protein